MVTSDINIHILLGHTQYSSQFFSWSSHEKSFPLPQFMPIMGTVHCESITGSCNVHPLLLKPISVWLGSANMMSRYTEHILAF